MNVREMLESGISPDELRNKLEEEINDAQASIVKEDIDKVRYNLVDAAIAYMRAMGWIDEDISEEDKKEFVNVLREAEDELNMYAEIVKMMIKKAEKEETSDDIIRKFLKNL